MKYSIRGGCVSCLWLFRNRCRSTCRRRMCWRHAFTKLLNGSGQLIWTAYLINVLYRFHILIISHIKLYVKIINFCQIFNYNLNQRIRLYNMNLKLFYLKNYKSNNIYKIRICIMWNLIFSNWNEFLIIFIYEGG